MNACLVDINVFLDYLLQRNGYEEAKELFNHCENKTIHPYVAAHEITTLSYYLEKGIKDTNTVIEIITKVLKTFSVIEINEKILSTALFSNIIDYEDAVIETSAIEKTLDYIITKNIKDFEKSKVKAILPNDFLKNTLTHG
jgi:predicted nucleic acid-binding protein